MIQVKSKKNAQSHFSKFTFLFLLKNHHLKNVNLRFWLKQSKLYEAILCIAVAHIFLCKLSYGTITKMEHSSAVKFSMVLRKL